MLLWTLGTLFFFWISVFSSFYIYTQGRIAMLHGISVLTLRNLHIVFHSGCTSLHFHQQCKRIILFSTTSPAFIVCWLFDDVNSDWYEVRPHCSFALHFPLVILSMFSCAFWPSICFLWRNVHLDLMTIFWLGCLLVSLGVFFFVVGLFYINLIFVYFGD